MKYSNVITPDVKMAGLVDLDAIFSFYNNCRLLICYTKQVF